MVHFVEGREGGLIIFGQPKKKKAQYNDREARWGGQMKDGGGGCDPQQERKAKDSVTIYTAQQRLARSSF